MTDFAHSSTPDGAPKAIPDATPESFLELTDFSKVLIDQRFLANEGVAPLALVVAPSAQDPDRNDILFVPGHFGDAGGKELFMMTVRAVVLAHQATSVMFISESWVVRPRGPESIAAYNEWRKTHKNLADHPDCEEIVFGLYEDLNGTGKVEFGIARDAEGHPSIVLGEGSEPNYFLETNPGRPRALGNMMGFFAPAAMRNSPEGRLIGQEMLETLGASSEEIKEPSIH